MSRFILSRLLLSVCWSWALAPIIANGATEAHAEEAGRYLSFGRMQLYASDSAIWLFLDVDEIGPSAGSEGPLMDQVRFVAMRAGENSSREFWSTGDDELTANSNETSFYQLDGAVHAVSNIRPVAWRLATGKNGGRDVRRVEPTSLGLAIERDEAGWRNRLQEVSQQSGFKLVGEENYLYLLSAYSSDSTGIKLSFNRSPRTLGWQEIVVE